MPLKSTELAQKEIAAFAATGVFGNDDPRVHGRPVPVYDTNGKKLFERFSVSSGSGEGHLDLAVAEELGSALLAVAPRSNWNPKELDKRVAAWIADHNETPTERRFVAYSVPKVGVQLLKQGDEIALLDIDTWDPVPPEGQGLPFFRRWSLLDEIRLDAAVTTLSPAQLRVAITALPDKQAWAIVQALPERRRRQLLRALQPNRRDAILAWRPEGLDEASRAGRDALRSLEGRDPGLRPRSMQSGGPGVEIHELPNVDYFPQPNTEWCVPASAQMMLQYHGVTETQDAIATELGLYDSEGNPIRLPDEKAAIAKVSSVLMNLNSENVPTVTVPSVAVSSPDWDWMKDQILTTGPFISFVTGHARVAVGYSTYDLSDGTPAQMLKLHDPWGTTGVIWRTAFAPSTRHACATTCLTHRP